MKKIVVTLLFGLILISASAQVERLVGPRIGMTFITAGTTADVLHEGLGFVTDNNNEKSTSNRKLGETGSAWTSAYGWQWETRFADGGGNIIGLVEWIALISGMEKGMFLPSVTSVIGARTSDGWEFGVGPTLGLSGVGMVFGFGKNFKSGNLNLPVNIVFSPGKRITGTYYDGPREDFGDRDPLYPYSDDGVALWQNKEYEYSSGARNS